MQDMNMFIFGVDPMARNGSSQCWVDVFDADCFMGNMRRLVGPQKLSQLNVKSLIVGPHAMVQLTIRRRGLDSLVTLRPKKVIPDLAAAVNGAKIRSASVIFKQ
jgi:hypothetical protein